MTNALQAVPRTAVTFTDDQVALIKRTICRPKHREATNDELALFVGQAKRTGLDPFSRQIYAVFRKKQGQEQMTIQAAIDGLRLIAERSGHYLGQTGPFWCDKDGQWLEIWPRTKGLPVASKVVVRKLVGGQVAETPAVAHWDEYAVYYGAALSDMWAQKPALMLAKCAEALALRKAFPNDMSGLYTAEEMGQADVTPRPVEPVVSDVPADASSFTSEPEVVEAVVVDPDAVPVDTIDPAFANDLLDACKDRLGSVGQFRNLLAGVGVKDVPDDLRSAERRLSLLAGLTLQQGTDLAKALATIPPRTKAAA